MLPVAHHIALFANCPFPSAGLQIAYCVLPIAHCNLLLFVRICRRAMVGPRVSSCKIVDLSTSNLGLHVVVLGPGLTNILFMSKMLLFKIMSCRN